MKLRKRLIVLPAGGQGFKKNMNVRRYKQLNKYRLDCLLNLYKYCQIKLLQYVTDIFLHPYCSTVWQQLFAWKLRQMFTYKLVSEDLCSNIF